MYEEQYPINYDRFRPIVADINTIPDSFELLGEGVESRVWRISLPTGSYAIKIAQKIPLSIRGRPMNRSSMMEAKINSGLLALNIGGLEQFVSGSAEDCVAVFELAQGVRLTDYTEETITLVTDEQKDKLVETVASATEAGLVFDYANTSGANAFYDPKNGFTLIDYRQAWWPIKYEENWSYALRTLGPIAIRLFND